LSGQLAQGQNLISAAQQTISSGDPNGIAKLLSAGMTFAQNATSTDPGVIVRDIIQIGSATAAGAAVGGPWGALAGAVVSSIEALFQSLFSTGPGDIVTFPPGQPTMGAQTMAKTLTQWIQQSGHLGAESMNPMGWSFYDYISRKYPPNQLSDSDAQEMWGFILDALSVNGNGTGRGTPGFGDQGTQNAGIIVISGVLDNFDGYWKNLTHNNPNYPLPKKPSSSIPKWKQYRQVAMPICTSAVWNWFDSTAIQNCIFNEWFEPSTSIETNQWRKSLWANDSGGLALKGSNGNVLSVQDIMNYAEANRPNSMFFASDLYVVQRGGYAASFFGSDPNQIFSNLETLTALAIACGMLAVGGGVQAISTELLVQQKRVHDLNGGHVPPLFRAFVEDFLAKAHVERAAAAAGAIVPATQTPLTTAGMVGAVAAGALGAVIVGVLAYSLATKTSPVETTRLAAARTRRLLSR
jgi:hypothetical protein